MKPILCATAMWLVLAVPVWAAEADDRFTKLFSEEWSWRQSLLASSEDSVTTEVPAHLPDISARAQNERLIYWQAIQAQVAAIAPATLTAENQVNYAVYKAQIDALVDGQAFRDYEMPVNSDSAFWSDLVYSADLDFRTEQDYRNYISLLSEVPRYFDQATANMKAGLRRGFTPPKVTLTGRDQSVASVIDARPEDSAFYKPFVTMPAHMAPALQAHLRAEGVKVINDAVIPAHRKLLAFLQNDYVPKARTSLGASELPDGKAYYQAKIREYTTLNLTPDQIHETGLQEVAKIRAEMLDIMKEVGFQGDLPAFLTWLRTDLKFYAQTPQALLDRAAWISKTVDGKIGDWIGRLPRQRFGIIPVPPDIAPYYTTGRGGPGVYLVNTYDLKSRPLFQLTALTLHESAPGHAFQMPLALENKALPAFRQKTYISAYGEGWALYTERLGVEMGVYETPYDRFGMLSYQMWRASRLVVDTGIHAKGWTREQAQAFLRDNTALSEHEVTTEIDRYISWPGQALSYYLGQMAIWEARHKAEAALGDRFNIRAFHDSVLELGSVPLPVMSAHIDRFIANGGVGPYPDEE
ncbi:hypothetical protein ABI_19990 [Asticcacaulis biprosthecium C19]|uniref:DUF885 family protein n=1 Tax=Asticcacaulis biprosthecium C19 TaxID=715226 RepID=F4QLY7_9CAUL|nr:DUF885 family protein [Asticcacaulis biprosthecium]EGF93559.1 hypothetical protein ABI_19990 [Asticcacaulis biprosthecium C19]